MKHTGNLGKQGEDLACQYLKEKGYTVIERNWRFGKKEVDIIASHKDRLVFVEVKTREKMGMSRPSDLIPDIKIRHIIDTAEVYIKENQIEQEARFDVILVNTEEDQPEIEHIIGAFYPT